MKYVVLFLVSFLSLGLAQPTTMSAELTLLFESIEEGNASGLASALEFGADVNGRNHDGLTPLMVAVSLERAEVVATLIASGADVNAAGGPDGYTALHFAAHGSASERIVTSLLEAGANPRQASATGTFPVDLARAAGNAAVAELLLDASADVALLFDAIEEGDAALFASVLAAGADVNGLNQDQLTPLMHAVSLDRAEFVDALIEAGADVNAATGLDGWTALHYAARDQASERIVLSLIEAGADVNSTTTVVVIESEGVRTVVRGGITPLMIAAGMGRIETVDALIAAGADVHAAESANGWTALHSVASNKSGELIVASLLRAGADPNRADNDGTLPVRIASLMRNTAVADQLTAAVAQPAPTPAAPTAPATAAPSSARLNQLRAGYDAYAGLVAEARTHPAGCVALFRALPASVRAYGDFEYAEGSEFVFVGYGPSTYESTNPILMMERDSSAMRGSLVNDAGLQLIDTIGVYQTTMGPIPQYSVYAGRGDLSWLTALVANDIASGGEARMCVGLALGPRP